MMESPRQTASGPTPPTVSGEIQDTVKRAKGPPIITLNVAVKNIISALGPRPKTALRSMLRVSKTSEAGSR